MSTPVGLSRADLALAGIAIPLLVAGLFGFLSSVGIAVALGAGSLPASLSMGYALFYRPPTAHESRR